MPRREHRVERENGGAVETLGQIGIVRYRGERVRIAKESQMRDDRVVDDAQKAGQKPEPRP